MTFSRTMSRVAQNLDKCVMTCNHQYSNIWNNFTARKNPLFPINSSSLSSLPGTLQSRTYLKSMGLQEKLTKENLPNIFMTVFKI